MIVVRFPDAVIERRALGFLIGRFSFVTQASGETIIPEVALAAMATRGIKFQVEGPARYEQMIPAVRGSAPS